VEATGPKAATDLERGQIMRHRLWLSIFGVLVVVPLFADAAAYTMVYGRLAKVDLRDGTWELVGPEPQDYVVSLEYSMDGFLYGVGQYSDSLMRIDPQTGASEIIGPLGVDVAWVIPDLAEDASGELWMLFEGGLFRVDRTTGAAVLECQANSPYLSGLTFIDGQMITAIGYGLPADPGCGLEYMGPFSINTATGPDNRIYLIHTVTPPLDPFYYILRFDPNSGTLQELAFFGRRTLTGLAISPEQVPPMPVPELGHSGVVALVVLMAMAGCLLLRRRF
jgi:hypothetical protein